MPNEIVDLVNDVLCAAPGLAKIKDWNKANGLVTVAAPGCSIGLEKDDYAEYTREKDEAIAFLSILFWIKNVDPASGEAQVRALAQEARQVLIDNRTLSGAAANSYVHGIRYTTAEGGKSLILHLAEMDYRVKYYSSRIRPETPAPIEQINNQVSGE